MKRRVFKLVLFLLLGAVVNVAVAWGCVQRYHRYRVEDHLVTEDDIRWWDAHVPKDFPGSPDGMVYDFPAFGVSSTIMTERVSSQTGSFEEPKVNRMRAGLPVRALEGSTWVDSSKWRDRSWEIKRHLMEVFDGRPPVPVRPIWPGFAINTVFYAALLWIVTLGPGTARRFIRHKRGRCINCGYDLRGTEHQVCPECGAEG